MDESCDSHAITSQDLNSSNMYLFQSQYPGLEGLPWLARNRIVRDAAQKYDRWWALRSLAQSSLILWLPFAALMTAFPLADFGLIDLASYRAKMATIIVDREYSLVGYSIFAGIFTYLRMLNSGFDRIVQAYLGDIQISASVGVNSLHPKSVGSQNALGRKFNWRLLVFLYVIVITFSSIVLISEFGQGIHKDKHIYNGVLDLKGVQLGMSEEEVGVLVPGLEETPFDWKQSSNYKKLSCKKQYLNDATGCRFTLANQTVKSADFYFHAGHLGDVVVKFEDEYFETVSAGLTEKYGSPYSEKRTPLESRLSGVTSYHIVKIWASGANRSLILMNHNHNGSNFLPTGIVQLVDRDFDDAREADSSALGRKPDNKDI